MEMFGDIDFPPEKKMKAKSARFLPKITIGNTNQFRVERFIYRIKINPLLFESI